MKPRFGGVFYCRYALSGQQQPNFCSYTGAGEAGDALLIQVTCLLYLYLVAQ